MNQGYEFLPHTADIKIGVWADNMNNLFASALKAMADILGIDETGQKDAIEKDLYIQSSDIKALLIDFLSEVLAQSDIENAIFDEMEIYQLDNHNLKAKIIGQKTNGFKEDIKAVTYHQLQLDQKTDGSCRATILFDI